MVRTTIFMEIAAYSYHRFVHAVHSQTHVKHHTHRENTVARDSMQISMIAVANWAMWRLAYRNLICSATYFTYLFTYNMAHMHAHQYMEILPWLFSGYTERHLGHHKSPSTNFGGLTPVVDMIMGTHDKSKKYPN